jgi:pyruvyl transferase EpsO
VSDGREGGTELLRALRERLDAEAAVLSPGEEAVLLDVQVNRSVGDMLLWRGTREWAARRGVRIAFEAVSRQAPPAKLAPLVGERTILLQAGGNFGDFYTLPAAYRRAVLAAFPRNRVVVLTQNLHYSSPEAAAPDREAFARHPRLTLFWRDRGSFDRAREWFPSATNRLVPDMAFANAGLEREPPASPAPVLFLLRKDREGVSAGGRPVPSSFRHPFEAADWEGAIGAIGPPVVRRGRNLRLRNALHALSALPPARSAAAALMAREMEDLSRFAARLVEAAREYLAPRPFVVTDYLHGHVLATLMRVPHVVLDNRWGKIGALYRAWTEPDPVSRMAGGMDEAAALADGYLRRGRWE